MEAILLWNNGSYRWVTPSLVHRNTVHWTSPVIKVSNVNNFYFLRVNHGNQLAYCWHRRERLQGFPYASTWRTSLPERVLEVYSGVCSSNYLRCLVLSFFSHPVKDLDILLYILPYISRHLSEIGYSAFDRYSPTFISSLQSTRGFIVVLWVLDDFTKVTT